MIVMESKKIGRLQILKERDRYGRIILNVYFNYIPVARFDQDDINERKLAVIELVERGHCNQTIAGKICGFHRNTVFKILRIKQLLGVEAVFEDNRGPKGPYKYIGEVRSRIKKLLRKYPDWKDQAIANKAAEILQIDIARSAVARIRTEKKDSFKNQPRKAELVAMAQIADAVDKRNFDDRQLELNFNWDKEIKQKSDLCSEEAPPTPNGKSEQRLIDRLQAGERCNFAGELMHHLFLQEIGFEKITPAFTLNTSDIYRSSDILSVLFHSINLDIPSIEALKLVNASEMGIVIGMNRAPEKEIIRDHLGNMARHYLSSPDLSGLINLPEFSFSIIL